MQYLREPLSIYIFFLGIGLILYAAVELIIPQRIFTLQKRWINHPFFPLHGLLLMAGAFPLTLFRESLPGKIMLLVGIVVTITGPFILLYPLKMRKLFNETEVHMADGTGKIIKADAVARIICGILFITVMIMYENVLHSLRLR